ncbi:hypothetical protein NDK50_04655 [Paraburkholderia bryophila]|uniref:hypothetical protein n=1 Tax=Paraburkholderia bryophila TaxID=420952 RepID=UPI00234B90EB|nr:hypothetical protein [Paraburkholderia bryophila]WCM20765.1 hypothetical protein NDK50_04655 [Paraburkholderia bryophila]
MALILPTGSRWRAQVCKRGQSIAKTFKTKGTARVWARAKEVKIDKVLNAVDSATIKVGELVTKHHPRHRLTARFDTARADWHRSPAPSSYEPERAGPTP